MDLLDQVVEDHARLRFLARGLPRLLGPQTGVGWEDRSDVDLTAFREAQEELLEQLTMHELREESLFAQRLPKPVKEDLQREVERAHEALNALFSLMRSVSTLCRDGRVHALRTTVARVVEELESHLEFEERALIPLIRASEAGGGGRALRR